MNGDKKSLGELIQTMNSAKVDPNVGKEGAIVVFRNHKDAQNIKRLDYKLFAERFVHVNRDLNWISCHVHRSMEGVFDSTSSSFAVSSRAPTTLNI